MKDSDHPSKYFPSNISICQKFPCQNFVLYGIHVRTCIIDNICMETHIICTCRQSTYESTQYTMFLMKRLASFYNIDSLSEAHDQIGRHMYTNYISSPSLIVSALYSN